MSQPATSSRLTNSAVNIIGATTAISTNFGLARIGVTGNSFDISSSSGTVTLGITGSGNVQLGNSTTGTVSFAGTTSFATLNSPAAGTNMTVGGNLTTGVLTLGSTASTTNLFGILDVARIEGPSGGSALTIGNNITSGSISIGSTSSNNTVNIGNVGAGPTGTVNVGTSSDTINVGTLVDSTINIGNTASGLVLKSSNISMGVSEIASSIVIGNTGPTAAGIINFGSSCTNVRIGHIAASNITIGNDGSSTSIDGNLDISVTGLTGTGSITLGATAMNGGNNTTTVNIGNTGTTAIGSLNLGRAASTINIGGNVASDITIGNAAGTISIVGPLDVLRIDGPAANSAMTIGSNITTGSISIGNTASNNIINIGNTGAGPTGTVNIGASSSFVNIGAQAGTVNIGNTTTGLLNINNPNMNIGVFGASTILIGNTAGSVTLKPPLTLGAAPTLSSQLGYTMELTIATNTLTAASGVSDNPFGTITIPVGVYQLNYQYRFRSSPSTTISEIIATNSLTTLQPGNRNYGIYINNSLNTVVNTAGYSFTASGIIVNATPSNVFTPGITVTYTPAGNLQYFGSNDCYVSLTRIG